MPNSGNKIEAANMKLAYALVFTVFPKYFKSC